MALFRSAKLAARMRIRSFGHFKLLNVEPAKVQRTFQDSKHRPAEAWIWSNPVTGLLSRVAPRERNLLGYSLISNGLVAANPRYSGVVNGFTFFHSPGPEERQQRIIVSTPPVSGFMTSFSDKILIKISEMEKIQRAVFVGSASAHNWYHWVIDTLPSVFLARDLPQEYDSWPLLISESALVRPHWIEILDLVREDRPIIPLRMHEYMRIEDLVWVHGPTARSHFASQTGLTDFVIERNSMTRFRSHILESLGLSFDPNRSPTRVFLARSAQNLRPYNHLEIEKIAGAYGFQILRPEHESLRNALDQLLHAEYIVGPHGAGWALALFAEQAKGSLIWTWDEAANENWFHNVLAVRGIPVETMLTGPGSNHSGYLIPCELFEARLKNLVHSRP